MVNGRWLIPRFFSPFKQGIVDSPGFAALRHFDKSLLRTLFVVVIPLILH
jgi:hypothetical protein